MLTNSQFLDIVKESFKIYLEKGSRSNAKLKPLHGAIARDIQDGLGDGFRIKSQGIGDDREGTIDGRYYSKNIDISVFREDVPVAGYELKFVERNYSQNSNNYFENMLGETANLRCNNIPIFQIFIIFDRVPYYKDNGNFSKYDTITQNNIDKYIKLSQDDTNVFRHTPDKTLFVLLSLKEKEPNYQFCDSTEYSEYYLSVIDDGDTISYSDKIDDSFGNCVILNDYEKFIEKTYHIIQGNL